MFENENFGLIITVLNLNWFCRPMLDRLMIVFIDDISVYSKTKAEHQEHLWEVLETLMKE